MKKSIYLYVLLLMSVFSLNAQNQLVIPDTLSGSSIDLNLQLGQVNYFSTPTNTMGVNGNMLGPTLILRKNQQVTINVTNSLHEQSTIHWHGLHVSPSNDGGPHTVIDTNTTWSPSFKVLDNASTYWYHPHLHMKTNEHVIKGIAGFIIVKDSMESTLELPRTYGVDDIPLEIQTKAFDANKQFEIHSALDSFLVVNGTYKPFVNLPAQMLRLRLAPRERAEILVNLDGYENNSINLINFGAELPNAIYGAAQPGMGAGQEILITLQT